MLKNNATEELNKQLQDQLAFRQKLLEKITTYQTNNRHLLEGLTKRIQSFDTEDSAETEHTNEELQKLRLVKYFVQCNAVRRAKLSELLVQKHRLLLDSTLVDVSNSEHIGTSVFERYTTLTPEYVPKDVIKPNKNQGVDKKRANLVDRAIASTGSLQGEFDKRNRLRANANPLSPLENYGFDERYSLGNTHAMDDIDDSHLFKTRSAITLQGLVKRVTSNDKSRVELRRRLILTHQSYCTSSELLTQLSHRFFSPLPPNLTPSELRYFKKEKLSKMRIKVVSVLKYWMEEHWLDDFADNIDLQDKMRGFIRAMESDHETTSLGNRLTKVLERQISKHEEMLQSKGENVEGPPPQMGPFGLLRQPPELIASQISLMNFHIFKQIKPRECLDQCWNKTHLKHRAPNILGLIEQWNGIGYFAKMVILNETEIDQRSKILAHLIAVADALKEMCNFCGAYSIYSALKCNPIYRLKKSFEALPNSSVRLLEKLDTLFHIRSNFMNLRNHMESCLAKPSIPHIGIFLQDFTFIDDGNKNMIDEERNLINWNKYRLLAKRIELLKMFQHRSWDYDLEPNVYCYITDFCKTERLDEEALYQLSCKREMRIRKPRKVTKNN